MDSRQQAVRTLGAVAFITLLASCSTARGPTEVPTHTSIPLPPPTPTDLPSNANVSSLLATAPEPYTLVLHADEIIGTWEYSAVDFARFDPDGTFRQANALAKLDDAPFAVSSYSFEDGQLTIRELSVSGVPSCGGKVGAYELRLHQGGDLQIVVIDDACGPRGSDIKGIYERIQ